MRVFQVCTMSEQEDLVLESRHLSMPSKELHVSYQCVKLLQIKKDSTSYSFALLWELVYSTLLSHNIVFGLMDQLRLKQTLM